MEYNIILSTLEMGNCVSCSVVASKQFYVKNDTNSECKGNSLIIDDIIYNHGKGSAIYSNEDQYEGECNYNNYHGYGKKL